MGANDDVDVFDRIKRQCDLRDTPVKGMEGFPLGAYGLTWREVRMGNIAAMAVVALKKGVPDD